MTTATPVRPLRAVRIPPRRHAASCVHAWVEVPATKWNDVQRAAARCEETPEFTDGCPGCEDMIGWRQWLRRVRPGRA